MNRSNNKIWFPAKKYGWGWGLPCCWQGWVVFAVFFVLLGAGILYFKQPADTTKLLLYVIIITVIFIIICWAKGEKPRWRWGG